MLAATGLGCIAGPGLVGHVTRIAVGIALSCMALSRVTNTAKQVSNTTTGYIA